MPDPATAHARRGAAFTFDGAAFLNLIRRLCEPLTSSTATIHAPSFDHALKDPVPDDIPIPPAARILVFEGNYIALDQPPWSEARLLMDEVWFVECELSVARRRLVERHLRTGVESSREKAVERVVGSDEVNGREILEGRGRVEEVVVSVEDGSWT
ncbi:MAG: hypothetical protein M1828_007363 [Chrysothrix sp. TS-e1954]|nr:MAG: hypothetical protein M1828_007363 [Chrysothrix sp. TS-e1954]